jgi:hypothetical protein
MVDHLNISGVCPQPEATVFCPAQAMGPGQRQDLALHALAGTETISRLAAQHEVSRKFIYQQVGSAKEGSLLPSGHQAMVGPSDPRADVDLPQSRPRGQ